MLMGHTGSMLVLKVGGNEIDEASFLDGLARAVAALREAELQEELLWGQLWVGHPAYPCQ